MEELRGGGAASPAGSLRGLFAAIVATAGTRVELLGVELREETVRAARVFVLATVAAFFLGAALIFAGALVVIAVKDEHRLLAVAAVTAVYAAAGIGILLKLRASLLHGAMPFSTTASELRADVDGLMGRPLKRP